MFKNNLSRSNYKSVYHTEKDFCSFYKNINPNFEYELNVSRYMTVNRLNSKERRIVYQGQTKVYFDPSPYCVNYKLGMFSKTRRPFFFRPKKKKR